MKHYEFCEGDKLIVVLPDYSEGVKARVVSYSNEELQKMLQFPDHYFCADNLPRWLALQDVEVGVPFSARYNRAMLAIKGIFESDNIHLIEIEKEK